MTTLTRHNLLLGRLVGTKRCAIGKPPALGAVMLCAALFGAASGDARGQSAPSVDALARRQVLIQMASAEASNKLTAAQSRAARLPGVRGLTPLCGPSSAAGLTAKGRTEWYVADLADEVTVADALDLLAADPAVLHVEPNGILAAPRLISARAADGAAVPSTLQQWALAATEAPQAREIQGGSGDIIVAVIDTGLDADHPDLRGNLWVNADEPDGIDNDDNGFTDDTFGWNFLTDSPDTRDDAGHGTHVAGIIGAVWNGFGIDGMADVRIMPLKVLDAEGRGVNTHIIRAIRYAVDMGARIINLSLGSPDGRSRALEDACRYAWEHGVLIVAASGNESTPEGWLPVDFPARLPTVIAVGASTIDGGVAYFSNRGEELELVAPGVDIVSTYPEVRYAEFSGTSMAAPCVAGVAALILCGEPHLSNDQVRQRLAATADDAGAPAWDEHYGYGRVNARRAVAERAADTVEVASDGPLAGGDAPALVSSGMGCGAGLLPGVLISGLALVGARGAGWPGRAAPRANPRSVESGASRSGAGEPTERAAR